MVFRALASYRRPSFETMTLKHVLIACKLVLPEEPRLLITHFTSQMMQALALPVGNL
jgi:hypothetical protein